MLKWFVLSLLLNSCTPYEVTNYIDPVLLQQRINNSQDGDVIEIEPGTCMIQTPLTIHKNIYLKGSGINKTIIVSNFMDFNTQPIYWVGKNLPIPADVLRISDMTFSSDLENGHGNYIYLTGESEKFRIDHILFENGGGHSITIDGNTSGVIDHCLFENDSEESISIKNTRNQNTIWNSAPSFPALEQNSIFIEDCEFSFIKKGTHAVTAINGARFVFRYNQIQSQITGALIDAHGNFEDGRSNYSAEIYNNTLENIHKTTYIAYGIYIRGGKALIFDNQLIGRFSYPIIFTNYRSWKSNTQYPSSGEYIDPDDGKAYYPNITDYNEALSSSDLISESYCWNNTLLGRMSNPLDLDGNTIAVNQEIISAQVLKRGYDNDHIQENRNYFNTEKPSYTKANYPHSLNTN